MWIQDKWNELPENWKYEIRSLLHSFISGATTAWIASGGGIPDSKEAVYGLLYVMVRSGVKSVSLAIAPQKKDGDVV